MLKKLLAACVGALLILACYPALAQEAPASGGVIDLKPFLTEIITVLGAAISVAVIALIKKGMNYLSAKTGVQLEISDEFIRKYLDQAIAWAVEYAITKSGGLAQFKVGNAAVADAVNYLLNKVPDALDHFGLSREALTEMVRVRMERMLAEKTAAVVEPTPTVPSAPVVATPAP